MGWDDDHSKETYHIVS